MIAGTSAGGLNGALLAAALAYERPLDSLRRVWLRDGSLDALTRDPYGSGQTSLLDGDGYFLERLTSAFDEIRQGSPVSLKEPLKLFMTAALMRGRPEIFVDRYGHRMPEVDHIAFMTFDKDDLADEEVTAQLALAARTSAAHPGGFEASYLPMTGEDAKTANRTSMAGRVRIGGQRLEYSRYAVDGGVLLNRPLKPALDAVMAQPASREVRRLMLFVAPDPGDAAMDRSDEFEADRPTLASTMLSAARLPMVQSVAEQLRDVKDHNLRVSRQQRLRRTLAASGPRLEWALQSVFSTYVNIRAEQAASTVLDLLTPGQDQTRSSGLTEDVHARLVEAFIAAFPPNPLAPDAVFKDPWSWGISPIERSLFTVRDLMSQALSLVPPAREVPRRFAPDLRRELRTLRGYGFALVERARQVRSWEREYWRSVNSGLPEADLTEWLTGQLEGLPAYVAQRDADSPPPWRDQGLPPPVNPTVISLGPSEAVDPRAELAMLVALLMAAVAPAVAAAGYSTLLDGTDPDDGDGGDHPPMQSDRDRAHGLLSQLFGLADIRAAEQPGSTPINLSAWSLDPSDSPISLLSHAFAPLAMPTELLDPLLSWLSPLRAFEDSPRGEFDDSLLPREIQFWMWRLLLLDIVQLPALVDQAVDQEIELIQVSARIPNCFDDRSEPDKKLTGLQASHFGAFYKSSWRANDWMWGRLDTAYHQSEFLLDPRRLRRLGYSGAQAFDAIASVARADGGDPAVVRYLLSGETDQQLATEARDELAFLDDSIKEPPASLPRTAKWVARRIQLEILMEELPWVARCVADDMAAGGSQHLAARVFLSQYLGLPGESRTLAELQRRFRADILSGKRPLEGDLSPAKAVGAFLDCKVGKERLAGEKNTDLFSLTATKLAATGVAAASGPRSGIGPVRAIVGSLRGATLAMHGLTRGAVGKSHVATVVITAAIVLSAVILASNVFIDKFDSLGAVTSLAVALLVGGLAAAAVRILWPVPLVVFTVATLSGFLISVLAAPSQSLWGLGVVVGGSMLVVALLYGGARAIRAPGWPRGLFVAFCLLLAVGGIATFMFLPIPVNHPGLPTDCGPPAANLQLEVPDEASLSPSPSPTATSATICAGLSIDWEVRALSLLVAAVGVAGYVKLRAAGDRESRKRGAREELPWPPMFRGR